MSPAGLRDQGAISNENPQLLVPTATGNGLARGHSRAAAPRDVSLPGLPPPGTSASRSLPSEVAEAQGSPPWVSQGTATGHVGLSNSSCLPPRDREVSKGPAGWDEAMLRA